MDVEHESARWVEQGIIDAEQRRQILALYPKDGEGERVSMGLLALFWVGGTLLFLGVAFLLGILWRDLGPLRTMIVCAIDGVFFGLGAWLRVRTSLQRTSTALLVIGGLLLPAALGISWNELFGSSGHPLPLVVVCFLVYAGLAAWLRSHAFCVLATLALFFIGEEIIRDDDFSALFPLVQLGLVRRLSDVFPVVFYSLAVLVLGLAVVAGRTKEWAPLRSTLWVDGLLLGLLPGLAGGLDNPDRGFKVALALGASVACMAASVWLRERKGFWVAASSLAAAFLILFGVIFEDSMVFVCASMSAGVLLLGAGAALGAGPGRKWLDSLFDEDEQRAAPVAPASPAKPLDIAVSPRAPAPATAPASSSEPKKIVIPPPEEPRPEPPPRPADEAP